MALLCSIVTGGTEGPFYSVGGFVFFKKLFPTMSLTASKTNRLSRQTTLRESSIPKVMYEGCNSAMTINYPVERDFNHQLSGFQRRKGTADTSKKLTPMSPVR